MPHFVDFSSRACTYSTHKNIRRPTSTPAIKTTSVSQWMTQVPCCDYALSGNTCRCTRRADRRDTPHERSRRSDDESSVSCCCGASGTEMCCKSACEIFGRSDDGRRRRELDDWNKGIHRVQNIMNNIHSQKHWPRHSTIAELNWTTYLFKSKVSLAPWTEL